jgi:hypothetical protein
MAAKETVPVVAPRVDPVSLEPYRKSQATKFANERPGFKYHWFRPDELPVKLRPHEIGSPHTGYLMVDAWEVVKSGEIELPGPGLPSGGKPLDTTVNRGDIVLCCTPEANFAKYGVIEKKMDTLIDHRLTGGERVNFGQKTNFKTRTVGGREGLDASATDVLAGVR